MKSHYMERPKTIKPLKTIRIIVIYSILILSTSCSTSEKQSFTLEPGKGFSDIKLGDSKEKLVKHLGSPTEVDGNYITFSRKGVQCLLEDNKIRTIFIYYRSRKHFSFDGATNKGIGFSSSIPDVFRKYGEPDRVVESTISQYGSIPGVKEVSLLYSALGITFTFWDNELADISIYSRNIK